jgi:hypothetical protein
MAAEPEALVVLKRSIVLVRSQESLLYLFEAGIITKTEAEAFNQRILEESTRIGQRALEAMREGGYSDELIEAKIKAAKEAIRKSRS